MSTAKITDAPTRLAKLVGRRGGVTIEAAVKAAESNLLAVRPPALRALDETLARMQALITPPEQNAASIGEPLYRLADSVVGIGAAVGLPDAGDAAYSLCELLDGLSEQGRWNVGAVEVHVSSLKLLRSAGAELDAAGRKRVVRGLRQATTAALARKGEDDQPPKA